MRKARIIVAALAVLLLAKPVPAGPTGGGAVDTGKDKARPAKVRLELTFTGTQKLGDHENTFTGSCTMWLDLEKGQYRLDVMGTSVTGNKLAQVEGHLLMTPEGTVEWSKKDGEWDGVRRRDFKTTPGKQPALEKAGTNAAPMIPYVDAAFGYERIPKELVMKEANSPLGEKDDLLWRELTPREGVEDNGLLKQISMYSDNVWLGLSPQTKWPMKYVIREEDGSGLIMFRIEKLDLHADFKDNTFIVPPDIDEQLRKMAGDKKE